MRGSQATLITYATTYDDIGQPVSAKTQAIIPVTVSSITRNEWSAAGQLGVSPDVRLSTPRMNYGGQTEVTFEGQDYGVYRTYEKGDIVELYLERKGGLK